MLQDSSGSMSSQVVSTQHGTSKETEKKQQLSGSQHVKNSAQRKRPGKELRVYLERAPEVEAAVAAKKSAGGSAKKNKSMYSQQIIQLTKEKARGGRKHLAAARI